MILKGTCVSPGKVEGRIKAFAPGATYTKEDIVILKEHRTELMIQLANAGGVISKEGSITSHASVIARELGLPCLVNVENADKLKQGMNIELDAAKGEVRRL